MLKPLNIPRGVAKIFMIGNSTETIIDETYNHRPDRVLSSSGMKSIMKELVNNYISNISPISCKNGTTYIITDSLFNAYFSK